MFLYTVDYDDAGVPEVCHVPCGVFDSEEAVMDFIKNNKQHTIDYEFDMWYEEDPLFNPFYIVKCWELNTYSKTPIKEYTIFRKDL